MSSDLALLKALLAHLRADPALPPLLGDPPRVHDQPPAEPDHPHVLVGRAGAKPFGGLEGEGTEHGLTLTCVSRFDGSEEARAVVAALWARLHNAPLTLEGHRLVSLRVVYSDVFRGPEGQPVFGLLRLRAVTEPA